MGAVYRASDRQLDRRVAVKVLLDPARDTERRERLMHEARAAAALQHPGIAGVYDVGVDGNVLEPWALPSFETPTGHRARVGRAACVKAG